MKVLINFLQGTIIGIANIIPGVSGGTMALVMGIYERFINALHNISIDTLKKGLLLFKFNKKSYTIFKEEMKKIDALFLLSIATGAVSAIAALATIMKISLNSFHDPTYGFFFGLVLASALVPWKIIKKRSASVFVSIFIAFALIIGLSFSMSNEEKIEKEQIRYEMKQKKAAAAQKNQTAASKKSIIFSIDSAQAIMIFIAGFISISAMILPGISGAFLLLLIGQYFALLEALNQLNLAVIGVFTLGVFAGIIVFSRFLNWLLKKYHDKTMGFLLGLVCGSLWLIWPFKNYTVIGDKRVDLDNIFPHSLTSNEMFTILTLCAGILIIAVMIQLEKRLSKSA
jgi:putative membrane protein